MNNELAPIVIKVGGQEIDDPTFLQAFAQVVKSMPEPVVIVHGGGKEISTLQQQLGIEPRYVEGLRVTDELSLSVVEMVLCGTVNKRLVRHLLTAGVDTLGMSGVDRGLIHAEQVSPEMGFTGTVKSVRGEILLDLLRHKITPVIAPVSYGVESAYNVNADHAAGAVAIAIRATRVVFLTNVEGVMNGTTIMPQLTEAQTETLIAHGTIFGGMIPKVRTALHALSDGVPQAVITNLQGLQNGGGTIFTKDGA